MTTNSLYRTTKIWCATLDDLRQIYALTGESMVAIMDRVVKAELIRIRKEKEKERK